MNAFARIGIRTLGMAVLVTALSAQAAPYFWTDWTGSSLSNGFTANGTITTNTSTINVTYNNPQGVAFIQTGGGTDYWTNYNSSNGSRYRDPATSPYTSTQVDNIPTGTDIIALRYQGSQTLQFSQTVANPVFSFVSLNGNGYSFLNQDFDILSVAGQDGNDWGYWGHGPVTKVVEDIGGGNFLYKLNAVNGSSVNGGEPHGTIRFRGAFDNLVWNSQQNENWNGFTVGVQGTAVEVFQTPEPGSLALMGVAMLGVVVRRRRA